MENNAKDYERARAIVEEKKKFHGHLTSYLIVNVIMLFTGAFFRGWIWAAFFWGIGVFSHFLKAYGFMGFGNDPEWEDKEIEKEMRRMKRQRGQGKTRRPSESDDFFDLNEPRPQPRKNYDEEDLV